MSFYDKILLIGLAPVPNCVNDNNLTITLYNSVEVNLTKVDNVLFLAVKASFLLIFSVL